MGKKDRKRDRSRSKESRSERSSTRGRSRSPKSRKNKGPLGVEDEEDVKDASKPKIEPLSLEELLARKKAEEAEKAKPKFLTKEERQAEALRRRAEAVVEARRIQDDEKKKIQEFQKDGKQELREMERAHRDRG